MREQFSRAIARQLYRQMPRWEFVFPSEGAILRKPGFCLVGRERGKRKKNFPIEACWEIKNVSAGHRTREDHIGGPTYLLNFFEQGFLFRAQSEQEDRFSVF